jgi:hypothetical protein
VVWHQACVCIRGVCVLAHICTAHKNIKNALAYIACTGRSYANVDFTLASTAPASARTSRPHSLLEMHRQCLSGLLGACPYVCQHLQQPWPLLFLHSWSSTGCNVYVSEGNNMQLIRALQVGVCVGPAWCWWAAAGRSGVRVTVLNSDTPGAPFGLCRVSAVSTATSCWPTRLWTHPTTGPGLPWCPQLCRR